MPRTAIRRLQKELQALAKSPLPGVLAQCDEKDVSLLHVLIVGAEDTPYAHGFFHFLLRYPPDYPSSPPRVRFMTTDSGTLRIHPNLYQNGKVCLSILGTWVGPGWTPSLTTTSVLLSIQSQIMQKDALRCEPGFEAADSSKIKLFDQLAEHETARVGILGQLGERSTLPAALKEQAQSVFAATGESAASRCQELARELPDGTAFRDPGKWNTGRKFRFGSLAEQLLEAWRRASPSAGSEEEESAAAAAEPVDEAEGMPGAARGGAGGSGSTGADGAGGDVGDGAAAADGAEGDRGGGADRDSDGSTSSSSSTASSSS